MGTLLLALVACAPGPGPDAGAPAASDPAGACVPATETCNGRDDDCDGLVDEAAVAGWVDRDGDGWGGDTRADCATTAVVAETGDCDDRDAAVHPEATERCGLERVDEDCDGDVNELGADGCSDRWMDADRDGWGAGDPACACGTDGTWRADVDGDCDDGDPHLAEDCTGGPIGDLAEADAVLVGETAGFAAGSRSAPFAASPDLGGAGGDWLVLGGDDGWSVVPVPSAGQVGVAATRVARFSGASALAVGDVDGDGGDDLLFAEAGDCVTDEWSTRCTRTLGRLPGPFAGDVGPADGQSIATLDCSSDELPAAAVLEDLDADGVPEVFVRYACELPVDWRLASGALEPTPFPDARDLPTPLGDLDGDGADEVLVFADNADGSADGALIFEAPLAFPAGLDDAQARVRLETLYAAAWPAGDVDGDGYGDLLLREGTQTLHLLPGPRLDGDADVLAVALLGAEDDGALRAVGGLDLDGDGQPDDVAVGEAGAQDRGAVYHLYGPLSGTIDLSRSDRRVYGAGLWDGLGTSLVATATALAVSAPEADLAAEEGGAVYLFAVP